MTPRRLLPTGLRIITLGTRFLLIFFLARFLPVTDVGRYGLLAATVSYALYAMGLDFYTFSTREVMRSDRDRWRGYLRSQLALASTTFVALAPVLLLLVFATGLVPWTYVGWFFLLLPLEYLGLELDRALISMLNQMGASVVLFVGGAMSPLTVVPLLAFVPATRHLSTVLATWTLFDAVAIVIGLVLILRQTHDTPLGKVDWPWIRRGIRVAMPFLAGTLCLRALFTADRELVRIFGDLTLLAAYTFFIGIGNGLTNAIYAAVQQFSYPHLVRAAAARDLPAFKRTLRSMFVQTVLGVVLIALTVLALEPLLLHLVGGVYRHYAWMLPAVLAVIGLYNISLVPHYVLYALDCDELIFRITAAALLAFAATAALLLTLGLTAPGAVIIAIGTASVVLWLGKEIPARRRIADLTRSGWEPAAPVR